jgi:uncharacterized membrane protein YgaE (UPF0421/DUF939 family)
MTLAETFSLVGISIWVLVVAAIIAIAACMLCERRGRR